MLPRRLPELRKDRMGRMRTACRRRHAFGARRRSLHLRSGHRPGPRRASKRAVALPSLTSVATMETAYEPEPAVAVGPDPEAGT